MSKTSPVSAIVEMSENCVAARLRSLNRMVSGIYDAAMRPLGLTISQLNILVVTGKFGTAKPKDICSILQLGPSTLSRNVDKLVNNGLIDIQPGTDGRAHVLELSIQGSETIGRAYPAWKRAQEKTHKLLGEGQTESIVAIANQVAFGKR